MGCLALVAACDSELPGSDANGGGALRPYPFAEATRAPKVLSRERAATMAAQQLRAHERITSIASYTAAGLGVSAVQVVVEDDLGSRA